jgi:ADP-heptose:LPS heptosyltransferase
MPTTLKALELHWRQALRAIGRRPFAGQVTARAEDILHLRPDARILLVRFERIGDVLVSVPVLRALRRRYPAARIDLLVSRRNYAVRDAVAPFVSRVWCYEKTMGSAVGLLRALHRARYDAIVDLVTHPSTTSQLVIRWCSPRAAVGLLHEDSGHYTHAAPALDPAIVHPVEQLAQLLLPFGIDPATEPLDLEYRLGPDDLEAARTILGPTSRPLRFGVNLSGRQTERYWGRSNYIALIRHVGATDPRFAISVCGTPRDAAEVSSVAEATGTQSVPPLVSLHGFAAVLHEFDLLVTPDTAVVHLAAAWKLPTVALYELTAGVAPWLPYRCPFRALVNPNGIPAIAIAGVTAAVDELIRERFGPDP